MAPLTLARLGQTIIACQRCPRLVTHREQAAESPPRAFVGQEYWARPVPGFGNPRARVLLVGLAPAAHGANRTGRMFTGDGSDGMGSSDFLARALYQTGFANQPSSRSREDGYELKDAYLTAICRCAPPDNRPLPKEIAACGEFLAEELRLLSQVRAIVALGKLAFDQTLRLLVARGAVLPRPRPAFAHGARVEMGVAWPVLLGSYHPSRQNTQTKRLTPAMLEEVFRAARAIAD